MAVRAVANREGTTSLVIPQRYGVLNCLTWIRSPVQPVCRPLPLLKEVMLLVVFLRRVFLQVQRARRLKPGRAHVFADSHATPCYHSHYHDCYP